MDLNIEAACPDDYFQTAHQIFAFCGLKSSGTLRVDDLMNTFAPFVESNRAQFSCLKSILDPDHCNPEINITTLAKALTQSSEYQNQDKSTKSDLDESFNLRSGQVPQDSDSGISTDGCHLVEELQCEVREKTHQAQKLRSLLEFNDRQHDEALAAISAERDSLKAHLNMLRDENITLTRVKHDHEEACERLCGSERELGDARRELDATRRKAKVLHEQVTLLENEKLSLQELLTKSKNECHRINEMYASRQSALLEENETLKAEHANLTAKLQDQDEFMQQVIKEKLVAEMELKDILNKSNHASLRMDRSIDVSYTDDQMLSTLDSINIDTRFSQDNQILGEESFMIALNEDHMGIGRSTNMSLFEEIRHSFSNMSKHNLAGLDISCDKVTESSITRAIQTDVNMCSKTIAIQTENDKHIKSSITILTQTDVNMSSKTIAIQTQNEHDIHNNNITEQCLECKIKCPECENLLKYTTELETNLISSNSNLTEIQTELTEFDNNLCLLQNYVSEGIVNNDRLLAVAESLDAKVIQLDAAFAKQRAMIDNLSCDTCCVQCQTESEFASVSTQAEIPCLDCDKRKAAVPHKSLGRYIWDPLKCLFQIFAVICFLCAVSALYAVTRRWHARCVREHVPWRWVHAQDLIDLFFRIEYVSEVPM